MSGMYSGCWEGYIHSSYTGSAVFNTKIQNVYNGIYLEFPRVAFVNYNEVSNNDTSIYIGSFRTDRMVIPFSNEVRYNYLKGTSYAGFRITDESVGPRRSARIKIENNKARGMDDYAVISSKTYDGSPFVNSDFMSEHTGSRMSRYRNGGFLAEGDTSSDQAWANKQQNFGRFGYDLLKGVYYFAEKDPSRPESTRFYNPDGDAYMAALGMELDVLDNVPFQIYIKFDYRVPLMANLQDDGTDDGRIRVYNIQHGTLLSTQYGVVPNTAGTDWQTFEGTFSNFASDEGRAGAFLTRSAQNGYMDIRNGIAYVLTDYPDKIKVISNTFILSNIWDQRKEYQDIRKLTAPTRSTKFIRVKL